MTFKEVRLSPKIGIGDFDTKVHRAIEFLEDGDRIKVTVRFRGRELTHPEIGRNLIARFADRVKDHGVPERTPLLEGKSMHITMASIHKPKGHDGPAPRNADAADAREGTAAPPAPAAATGSAPAAATTTTADASATTAAAPVPEAPTEAPTTEPGSPKGRASAEGRDTRNRRGHDRESGTGHEGCRPDQAGAARPAAPATPKASTAAKPTTAAKSTTDKTPAPEPVRTGE